MRSPVFLVAIGLALPALAAPRVAPTSVIAKPAARSPLACPDLQYLAKQRPQPRAELKKLNQLPPADTIYAMLRTKDGCPDLTPVRFRR